MVTAKSKAATGPNVTKSVTATIKESTLSAITAAADVVGAPKDANVALGNTPYMPVDGETENTYPYQVTFSWSESVS